MSFADGLNDGKGQVITSRADLTGITGVVRNYVFRGGVILGKSAGLSFLNNDVSGGGIVIDEGAVNSVIAGNNFHDVPTTGIFADNGKNPVGLTIRGNQFAAVWEPIHLQWVGGPKFIARCKILYNTLRGVTRHGIECQGDPGGDPNTPPGESLIVAYNWIDDWVPAAYHIGLSIATGGTGQFNDRCRGVKVLSNVVGGANLRTPGFPDWNFCAIEAFGDDTEVAFKFMARWGVGVYYNWNTPALSIHDNTGVGLGHTIAGEGSGKPVAPAAVNVYGNRWLPAGALPTPPPPSADGPVITPANGQPMNITATVTGKNELTFAFTPAVGVTYQWIAGAKGDAAKKFGSGTAPAGGTIVVGGVPDQWEVQLSLTGSDGSAATVVGQYFDSKVPQWSPAATVTVTTTVTTTTAVVPTVMIGGTEYVPKH